MTAPENPFGKASINATAAAFAGEVKKSPLPVSERTGKFNAA